MRIGGIGGFEKKKHSSSELEDLKKKHISDE
jgi:hypothetical protein